MNQVNYLTITQLSRYLKYKFDEDINLRKLHLKGEISNFKAHTRGNYYFTLKDENSRINAVMFNGNARYLDFKPEDGMNVLVEGRIQTGSYENDDKQKVYYTEVVAEKVTFLSSAKPKENEEVKCLPLYNLTLGYYQDNKIYYPCMENCDICMLIYRVCELWEG